MTGPRGPRGDGPPGEKVMNLHASFKYFIDVGLLGLCLIIYSSVMIG